MYSKHIVGRGKEFFALAQRESLEGIIGKRRDVAVSFGAFARLGQDQGQARRRVRHRRLDRTAKAAAKASARCCSAITRATSCVRGQVGTGFDGEALARDRRRACASRRKTSPFANLPKMNTPPHFVPALVAQVAFAEWTREGLLRQPVFLGLRSDKDPKPS
jgi:bifunctional non-homologous end joining protein LigD